MKKLLILITILIIVTGTVYFYNSQLKESSNDGDAPLDEGESITLNGTVKNPVNDTFSISELQTSYILSVKEEITFDELIIKNIDLLSYVHNVPFTPLKGYLFSVGLSDASKVQYYYQSNQEETRTVIYRVEAGEKKNLVTKVFDGEYQILIHVNEENPNQLIMYDYNQEESILEVN